MSLENALTRQSSVKVVASDGPFCFLDLSVENNAVPDAQDLASFENYLTNYLKANSCSAAFGGYNEKRNLYKRSPLFNDDESEERDIHIGLDIWTNAETPVLAALDGTIHSFDYNVGIGNYGPTIILEHELGGNKFFTLYGHLSMESIEEKEIGDKYKKGQEIGTLGDASVNGNYAPHLHFQIIKDIGEYFADYPGVCPESEKDYFLSNCPDPNLLLKLNQL